MASRRRNRGFLSTFITLAGIAAVGDPCADTLRVSPGGTFPTLASALSACENGDVIEVGPGIYREHGLLVRKSVAFLGKGMPVVDAEGAGTILEIRAHGVEVAGFRFRNVGVTYLQEQAAVWITRASEAVIRGNRFERNFFSVYASEAGRLTVSDNAMEGLQGSETSNGNGIHLWKCDSVVLLRNDIRWHRDGIYLEFTGNSLAAENLCEGNVRYGLHFMFSHANLYQDNVFRSNGAGVAVMYSRKVGMRGNRFEDNWGPASYGLLLKSIDDSRIEGNAFVRNTVGIFQENSSGLVTRGNAFRGNGWALRILADCDRNSYRDNRFDGNTFDVAYNASQGNSNVFRRNHWDRYSGWDLNHDGLGDVPHRPVDFFSTLMREHPQAMALLRSHFVSLLNLIEKLFPTLAPASLEDTEPLMPKRGEEAA